MNPHLTATNNLVDVLYVLKRAGHITQEAAAALEAMAETVEPALEDGHATTLFNHVLDRLHPTWRADYTQALTTK